MHARYWHYGWDSLVTHGVELDEMINAAQGPFETISMDFMDSPISNLQIRLESRREIVY